MPVDKPQDIEKTVTEVQTQNSNGEDWNPEVFSKEEVKQVVNDQKINSVKEAKEIQKALTIAEKALTSQNWQAELVTKLHEIKDGKPVIYQATKTQIDRAIQHLKNLHKSQKQEPTNEQNRNTSPKNSEENRFTTGQKLAIAFGIIGGVILVGVIIGQVIKSKKKQNK